MTPSSAITRRDNGAKAEDLIMKFYHARPSGRDEYDLETRNMLVEVKSCEAFTHSGIKKGIITHTQCGRFLIDKTNHCALKRLADEAHKKATYAFVVIIDKRPLIKLVQWSDVPLKTKKMQVHISWKKIFVGEA